MNEEQLKEILDDPKKLLDVLRLFHQLIHLYDERELRKEMLKGKSGANETTGLGDTLSIAVNNKTII